MSYEKILNIFSSHGTATAAIEAVSDCCCERPPQRSCCRRCYSGSSSNGGGCCCRRRRNLRGQFRKKKNGIYLEVLNFYGAHLEILPHREKYGTHLQIPIKCKRVCGNRICRRFKSVKNIIGNPLISIAPFRKLLVSSHGR